MPTYNLLDFLPMACLLYSVDTLGLNMWLCVVRHITHDTRLTTVTDVVGFAALLGLGAIFLV
jgi:hypothetical protein